MKLLQFTVVILAILVSVSSAAYTWRKHNVHRAKRQALPAEFRNFNIETYLKNPRAVQFQIKCLVYNGPCDRIGQHLKANVPVWLNTQCRNCNAAQKQQASKLITYFQTNYPKEWNDAVRKYKGGFTPAEIKRFETELGVRIQNNNVPAGNARPKPNNDQLAQLAKESIAVAQKTAAPNSFQKARSTENENSLEAISSNYTVVNATNKSVAGAQN